MVITGEILLELFLKWVVPFLCMGIVSFITYLIAHPKKIYKKGAEAEALEEWESIARKSNLHEQLCGQHLAKLQKESEENDKEILKRIDKLTQTIDDNKNEAIAQRKELESTIDVMREGILDTHLINLIYTCERFIRRGYITPSELDHYKQRLDLYHRLGGNGHMDYWDKRIDALPHQDLTDMSVQTESTAR